VFVQAKTYHGGGEWYALDLDYSRIAKILGRRELQRLRVGWRWKARKLQTAPVPKSIKC